jgi:Protein of unknown function (DUF2971)
MVAHIPPRYLYRYRPANTRYFEDEVERAIGTSEIYFSRIANVNDPFEASPFIVENSIREVRQYLKAFEKKFGKGVAVSGTNFNDIVRSLGVRSSKLRKLVGPSLDSAIRTMSSLRSAAVTIKQQLRVACLSEQWDSLLMWGHYGQSHTGICIEYETQYLTYARHSRAPVSIEYVEERPRVSFLDIMEHMASKNRLDEGNFFDLERVQRTFTAIALTKPVAWEYEREWRVMDIGSEVDGYVSVPSLRPKSILLGANHANETLQKVRSMVAGRIEVEVVSLDKERFALRRREA